MKMTSLTKRLQGTGEAKWEVYVKARALAAQGKDVIEMTIGEPDIAPPKELLDAAADAMYSGRTTYSLGRGEPGLCGALAQYYTQISGRKIRDDQFICFPGTQTGLYAALMGVAETGDEVIVGDPMYATYEGVVLASDANMVIVPLRPDNGFRISAEDIAAKISPRTRAVVLTTPHNPTGAVLTREDLAEIGKLALEHDFWIISDEVYGELVFDGVEFTSALAIPEIRDRTIVVSSISKSHAAPGFRSGWLVAPSEFIDNLLPLAEAMLFGNQPFIADMTEFAIRGGSSVAAGMSQRYAARAKLLAKRLSSETVLEVIKPDAGMFAMVNVAPTGMSSKDYAHDLLDNYLVAVMPGSSFGETVDNWVRIALTINDEQFSEACDRIIQHANASERNVA